MNNIHFLDRNCTVCGKYFLVTNIADYAYKGTYNNKKTIMCSYTCFSKWKKSPKKIMEAIANGINTF